MKHVQKLNVTIPVCARCSLDRRVLTTECLGKNAFDDVGKQAFDPDWDYVGGWWVSRARPRDQKFETGEP